MRIGRSGWVAIAAVVLAAGAIGYRVYSGGGGADASQDLTAPTGSIAVLEARAKAAPNDAGAWQKLGFAQFDAGNYVAAVSAYEHATRLSSQNAVLWSSLGEARVMASQKDPMPPAALEAFRKAVALDAKDPRARYFLAVEKDLKGDHNGAIADWLALLKDTPAGAPWDSDLQRTIEQVGKINSIDVAGRIAAATADRPMAPVASDMAVPGPTKEQLAAASAIAPGEQQEMAEGMVSRLAQRLEDDPANVDGWVMLMRSYKTLGRDADAKAALGRAIAANPARADELHSAAATLGLAP